MAFEFLQSTAPDDMTDVGEVLRTQLTSFFQVGHPGGGGEERPGCQQGKRLVLVEDAVVELYLSLFCHIPSVESRFFLANKIVRYFV